MEFNYRAMDERAHSSDQSPLSRYNYFTEKPNRGGYSTVGMRLDSDYFQSSVREAIHRELEIERSREGFVEENSGRRSVEDELRRDLRTEKELALRGRGVDEVGRFQAGMGMRVVEDRRMTVNEEKSLEERISNTVEERIVSSLEGRIVMALERSGMAERIARTVEERIARTFDERIAIFLEERIAKTVEERIAISLERFGTEARRGIGEQPLVPFRPGRVEHIVKEAEQPPSHVMKEAKSDANRCNTNTPPKQGVVRNAASTDVTKNIVKEDWSCVANTNAPPKQSVRMTAASTDVAKNTSKEVWSCSLCKVNTTSQRALEDHVRGKKHKLKEDSLNLGSKRKNSDIVLPPNKKAH